MYILCIAFRYYNNVYVLLNAIFVFSLGLINKFLLGFGCIIPGPCCDCVLLVLVVCLLVLLLQSDVLA